MGVWVLHDQEAERAVLYDSNREAAIETVSFVGPSAREQAWSFLGYLATDHNRQARDASDLIAPRPRETDPRHYTEAGIERAHSRWRDISLDEHGRLNDYGWQLLEWQESLPAYGEPRELAPEPAKEGVA